MTKADKKFHRVLREYKNKKLRSASTGKIVRDKNEALAIAFSEAREIDKKYKLPTQYENGAKIKTDNTLQLVFEDAWQKYLDYLANDKEDRHKLFEQWLRETPTGLKYNKRMAQLIRDVEFIDNEPIMNERGAKISNNNEHRGGKLRGKRHIDGGIEAIIVGNERPVELEEDELVITRGVAQSTEEFVCSGHPEAIASELNVLHGGDKISTQKGECHLKNEIMERGKKIKSHINESKNKRIQSMIIRDNVLKNKQKMENGAKIDEQIIYLKINEPQEFEILEFVNPVETFRMQKVLKTGDLLIMKHSESLQNFLDAFKIHYTEFDNKDELDSFLVKKLPNRIKNTLKI